MESFLRRAGADESAVKTFGEWSDYAGQAGAGIGSSLAGAVDQYSARHATPHMV